MGENPLSMILLVEDEKNLGLTLMERLRQDHFGVSWVTSLHDARETIKNNMFQLALMDVGLPDGSGFDLAAELRKTSPTTAIIFMTAYGNPEDRIHGLELGAEDYVVKPFHLKELLLRIQNVLKRTKFITENSSSMDKPVKVGKVVVDFSKFEASVNGQTFSLTHKETALLRLLVTMRGKVISRDEILDHVWSKDEFPSPRTVDNFIMRLRRLVEKDAEHPEIIKSIRGVGYQLVY
ncbi:MAG: response regulator transcription factor [Bdellovibrionota bacterium]